MRKVHYKVVLDVFVHEDDDANCGKSLESAYFNPNIDGDCFDVMDVIVESVEVTDSR